jgi:hypothetical protein
MWFEGKTAAVVITLGLLWTTWAKAEDAARFEHYCSATGTTTLLVVDVTYDEQDRALFLAFAIEVLKKLDGPGRFVIRTIEDSFAKSRKLVSACVPYCPPLSWWNQIFSTCTVGGLREDQKHLAVEVREAISTILRQSVELPSSAIIRTLATGLPAESIPGNKTSLFVLSDMIENSEVMGARKLFSTPNGALISELASAKLIPDLKNADVRAVGIGRAGSVDRRPLSNAELQKLQNFWDNYFKAGGAASVVLSPTIPQNL